MEVVSLILTFLFMWHGRDKPWTPTFKGTRVERFTTATRHYEKRMGLDPATVFVSESGRIIHGEQRCAWTVRDEAWTDDVVAIWTTKRCNVYKPEVLALHEQCHRRMGHLEPAFWEMDQREKEREVKKCMLVYSAKERR